MRRAKRLLVITAAVNGLVLLPFAINVVTGGSLPRLLEPYRWLSWPAIAVFGLIAIFTVVQGVGELPRRPWTRRGLVIPEDRTRAMENIRSYVRVRLDQTLGQVVRAQLDLETRPEAVALPTDWYVGVSGRSWEPKDDASVIDAYDRFDESLLILGEPGAGKTTMLLELADALLVRTGETGPLPVLVELGSWGQKSPMDLARAGPGEPPDFHAWLLGQLQVTYRLGRGIAEAWLRQRGLVVMLDGLDEVAPAMRARCVQEINQLQQRYPRLRIVVTSRAQEYDKLRDPLVLRGAILIRPLTAEKVREYLSDPALVSLRRVVEEDTSLFELLTAPLWLFVMSMAFQHNPRGLFFGTLEERRRQLFDAYVARMLARQRGVGAQPDPAVTVRRLAQVAHALQVHHETVIPSRWQKRRPGRRLFSQSLPKEHSSFLVRRVFPLTVALLSLPMTVFLAYHLGPIGGLVGLLVSAGIPSFFSIYLYDFGSASVLPLRERLRGLGYAVGAILIASVGVLLAEAVGRMLAASASWLGAGLASVVVIGPWVWSFVMICQDYVKASREGMTFLERGDLLFTAFTVVVAVGIVWWAAPLSPGLIWALVSGIVVGSPWVWLVGPLVELIPTRLSGDRGEIEDVGIGKVGVTACLLLCTGLVGLLVVWGAGLALGSLSLRSGVLLVAAAVGSFLLNIAVSDWIIHTPPRWALACLGLVPWRMRPFLEHAADRSLIQRVPDGYRFPHQLITQYFAEQNPVTASAPTLH